MLEGYKKIKHDIIKKIEPVNYVYGPEYLQKLKARGELNTKMAYLRYGNEKLQKQKIK